MKSSNINIALKTHWHCSLLVLSSFIKYKLFQNCSFEHTFNNFINKDDTIGCYDLQSVETDLVEATGMTDTCTEQLGWSVLLGTLKDMHQ